MKIMDLISQHVNLEKLAEKRTTSKVGKEITGVRSKNDSVNVQRKNNELTSILQIQNDFNKNTISLNGFMEMKEKIDAFQKLDNKDYEKLSKELSAISKSVKFNGENIISYLDTNIKDEQSLYTLNMNLSKEIENVKLKVAKDRKILASFLVMNENRDSISNFSIEKVVNDITDLLNEKNISKIYKIKENTNKLLS